MSRRRALGLAVLAAGAAAAVLAQTTGDIEGRIADPSGTPLPGATVEATSPRMQGTRVEVSGVDGKYRVLAVPPGTYRIRASLEGFETVEESVTVALDATATLDLTLRLVVKEAVTVTGEIPLVDVTSTTSGTNYTDRVIARLPVQRNYADIVRSNPGVDTDRGETQGRSLALTIYGATSVENQWIIDGINTTNVVKGLQGKAINNEFVQEVEVKTGGYQAEYGRALGGIVNVITKSGGNEFHGDVFAYYDSAATRAAQVVTEEDSLAGMKITPERRTDYGVDVGGYVVKDALWFFGAYNRVETPGTTSRFNSTPLVPNTLLFPRDQTDNLYSGKLTWNIRTGSTLVATVFSDPSTIEGAALVGAGTSGGLISSADPGTWESHRDIGGADYGVRASQVFGSRAFVTVSAARHQDRFELVPLEPSAVRLTDLTCEGGTPDNPCQIPFLPNSVTGGIGFIGGVFQRNHSRRDQLRADSTLYFGDHEVKVGGDWQDGKTNLRAGFTGGQEVIRFNEYGQTYYFHDAFVRSLTDLTPIDAVLSVRAIDKGIYVQDSWRTTHWTVNLGLRFDQEDIRNAIDRTVFKTSNEWQPRVGVVWDPGGDGRMKAYASAGRFYYGMPTELSVFAYHANVEVLTFNFSPVDLAQDPNVIGHDHFFASRGGTSEPIDPGIKGTYQDELTVGVERLLDPTLSIGVKGTYRRLGRTIENRCDLDYSAPANDAFTCATINPGSGGPYASGDFDGCNGLDGQFYACGHGTEPTPPARRLYRGIEVMARKTVNQRLWLQASYVYSSLRGNFDGGVYQAYGQSDPGTTVAFDYPQQSHLSYGRLFLDRPHRGRLDVSYTTPFRLFGGLQAYVESGTPLDQMGYLNFFYGPVVPLVQRGYAGRLPTLWEANLTLGYPITIGPVTVTLQAFLYNIFNNQIRTQQDTAYTINQPAGYPDTLYDPNVPSNNPNYEHILARQDPRLFRAAVRVSF
jgi:hypothetical protein